jgi:hypothetical protein
MKDRGWIEPIVERVVGQVLDSHTAQLRTEIVRRVMDEIAAEPAAAESSTPRDSSFSAPAELARAVSEIQMGSSQREILRALLDTCARYSARIALFVVKGTHATGWQGRGFANSDAVKDFALDEKAQSVTRAIGERVVVSAPAGDFDGRFLNEFGAPASGEARVLPLILKDKVAALVYADSGVDSAGLLDGGALELLVLSTSAWLEVNSLRKQAHKESPAQADGHSAPAEPMSASPAQAVPAFNDPFAAHAPAFSSGQAMAAAAGAAPAMAASPMTAEVEAAPEVQSAVVMEPALAEPLPIGQAEATVEPPADAPASMSAVDQEVHRKAQRFSRLLVDEIKLYNQAKVAEGRKNKDLYDRLKEAIEKSRATYQKRYGNTVAASANYFQHEIIRSLAEDDLSIMGANFRH